MLEGFRRRGGDVGLVGGTCRHCHNYYESIHYTDDYGEICKDCSVELTRPYIAETRTKTKPYTHKVFGTTYN
jgi:hypothetical protein